MKTLEKIIGIALILFGCFLTFSSIGYDTFDRSNQTGIAALLLSNALIIIAGTYLLKSKE